MLLTQVMPEGLNKIWDLIRFSYIQSTPPTAGHKPEDLRQLLVRALNQQCQVWIISDEKDILSIALTAVCEDGLSKVKYLDILSLFNYKTIGREAFDLYDDGLTKFAKSSNCVRILGLTNNEVLLKIAEIYGYATDYKLIVKEL